MSQSVDTSTLLSSVVGNVDVSDLPDIVLANYDADATNKLVPQSVSVGTGALSKGHPLHRSATVENRVWRSFEALPSQTFLLAGGRQKSFRSKRTLSPQGGSAPRLNSVPVRAAQLHDDSETSLPCHVDTSIFSVWCF